MVSGTTTHADVVRGTTARMRRSAEATWQGRRWLARGEVVHRVRTRGKRPCGSTRTPMRGATWQGGWQLEGPQAKWALVIGFGR